MTNFEPDSLNSVIQQLTNDASYANNIAYLRETDGKEGDYLDFLPEIHPLIRNALISNGINSLYSHQAEALSLSARHENFVISTGTSSGKSLCYQLPILNSLYSDRDATALMLFPTKALTNDQLNSFGDLIPSGISGSIGAAIYDGDTPQRIRAVIREKASIVLSNPDMLNIGILPHHPLWDRFFTHLKFVVIDEIHIYRGVFGSHVANLLRRLRRITRFYGSDPIFILTSATIHNPQDLAEKLIEEKVTLIDQDGSPQGKKFFLVYNPPIVNEEFGIREGLLVSTGKILSVLYQRGIQTLVFCRTRRFVEILLRDMRGVLRIPNNRIRGYRSGYLKSERREIESGLKSGEITIGVATNALELGVDIGGVDAVLLPGYPGTISALLQRAGRAGRKFNPSLAVFIASMNPLDQFLARNPQYLLSRNPEQALINPNNPLIMIEHIQCAAAEMPIEISEGFGRVKPEELLNYLNYLKDAGLFYYKNEKYHWVSNDYPSQHVSLRNTPSGSILLRAFSPLGDPKVIGEVDYNSGLWMVHQGAVYIHDGETYHVDELDLEKKVANLSHFSGDYFTEPVISADVEILTVDRTIDRTNYSLAHGEVVVKSKVSGFKRINWTSRETIDTIPLDLPETSLRTIGFWAILKPACVEKMRTAGLWRSDPNNYGPGWKIIRDEIRKRDHYTCQVCGKKEDNTAHHVHHKIPFKSFTNPDNANQAGNLITLCPDCHSLVESQVRVRSALSGLNQLLGSLAPLMVMSDSGDLGNFFDPAAKFAEGQPALIFYDNVPAGIGLTDILFDEFEELLERASLLVETCECSDGCPSCVGPAFDTGGGGKSETRQLIKYMQE